MSTKHVGFEMFIVPSALFQFSQIPLNIDELRLVSLATCHPQLRIEFALILPIVSEA